MVEDPNNQNLQPGDKPAQPEELQQPSARKLDREPRVARTMLDISVLQKKGRKVAKTLLEQDNPLANLQGSPARVDADASEAAAVQSNASEAPQKLRKIDRTMLELDIAKISHVNTERYVAKTMLDHSMLFQAVSNSTVKMEQKAAEIARERANEPPVEPIKPIAADRQVAKCEWSWTDPFNGKERYRACARCQASVYDFEGLERPQAEAIVFQRENLKKPKFYARSDGKFMTRDCPKQVARKAQLIMLSVLAVVSVASVILVMMLIPSIPKSDRFATSAPESVGADRTTRPISATAEDASSSSSDSSSIRTEQAGSQRSGSQSPTSLSDVTRKVTTGNFHYENGRVTSRPVPAIEESVPTVEKAAPKGSSEENPLWESH